jgi:hypothetical protein
MTMMLAKPLAAGEAQLGQCVPRSSNASVSAPLVVPMTRGDPNGEKAQNEPCEGAERHTWIPESPQQRRRDRRSAGRGDDGSCDQHRLRVREVWSPGRICEAHRHYPPGIGRRAI